MRGNSHRVVALHAAAVCTTLAGMFTTWAGAVRWQHCWGSLGPCRTMGDEFYDGAYTGGTPPTGIQEPLMVAAVLIVLAVLLLAWCGRRPLLGTAAVLVATAGIAAAREVHRTGPAGPRTPWDLVLTVLVGLWLFGGLLALGAAGWSSARSSEDRVARVAWAGVAGIGATTNVVTSYLLPQTWADSWDDPTWMWSVDGTLTVLVGLALVWAAGRAAQVGHDPVPRAAGTADLRPGADDPRHRDQPISGSVTPRPGR